MNYTSLLDVSTKLQIDYEKTNGKKEEKREFKKMTDEDFKFLEGAFEQYYVNETKEIIKSLDQIKGFSEDKEEEKDNILILLENIKDMLSGLETGRSKYIIFNHYYRYCKMQKI